MRTFIFCCLLLILAGAASAETIVLKSGSTVQGKIVERLGDNVKVDVGGMTVTYYNDEIDRIDGGQPADSVGSAPKEMTFSDTAQPVIAPAPEAVGSPEAAPVASVPGTPLAAEPSGASKKELILKFIEVFGTRETMQNNFEQMASSLPPDLLPKFKSAINVDGIIQELLPLYDKYFSKEDLNAYISFYSSPEGQKLIKTIPLVMKDSIAISEKYFEKNLPEEFKQPATPQK